jgi:hypothetical protein
MEHSHGYLNSLHQPVTHREFLVILMFAVAILVALI